MKANYLAADLGEGANPLGATNKQFYKIKKKTAWNWKHFVLCQELLRPLNVQIKLEYFLQAKLFGKEKALLLCGLKCAKSTQML